MKQYSFSTKQTPIFYKNGIQLYHISIVNLDGKTLRPRVPGSLGVFDGWKEDTKTPRVCFGRSIKGCLTAVPNTGTRKVWYVHVPVDIDPKYIKEIGFNEVPDSEASHEIWYLKPVKVKCIGQIFIEDFKWLPNQTKHGFSRIKSKYVHFKTDYTPPYCFWLIREKYGIDKMKKMCGCHVTDEGWKPNKDQTPGQKAHYYRAITGIELIHKEPTLRELKRVWSNWNKMIPQMKKESDEKSKSIFGKTNAEHYKELIQRNDYNDL